MLRTSLLLISICLLLAFRQDVPPGLKLFLLIGQSNMAGRGLVEAGNAQENPAIWMLAQDLKWVPAKDPMHFDKPAVVGVGPGLAFAESISKHYKKMSIGLIPCAVGGSGIDVWKPGMYYEPTQSHPYDDALTRAKAALKQGELAGILWHQGESDSSPDKTAAYETKLAELIQRLRQDLNAPNLPFVAGTLGDFVVSRNIHAKAINASLQNLLKNVANTYCILSSGLVHKGDSVHFDAPSARILGQRYAKIFMDKKWLETAK